MTPDRLQALSQILAFVGVVLAALGSLGAWYFDKKVSDVEAAARAQYESSVTAKLDVLRQGNESLRDQLKPFEELATTRYPTTTPDKALDALVRDITRVEQIAVAADKALRSMTAEATLLVTGSWRPMEPGGHSPLSLPTEDPYVILEKAGNEPIHFFPTYVKRFNDPNGVVRLIFRAAARDGSWPLGQQSDILHGYVPTKLAIPMLSNGDSTDGRATLARLDLKLSANGKQIYIFSEDINGPIVLPAKGWRVASINLPPLR